VEKKGWLCPRENMLDLLKETSMLGCKSATSLIDQKLKLSA
jgi:hypothetical protein